MVISREFAILPGEIHVLYKRTVQLLDRGHGCPVLLGDAGKRVKGKISQKERQVPQNGMLRNNSKDNALEINFELTRDIHKNLVIN